MSTLVTGHTGVNNTTLAQYEVHYFKSLRAECGIRRLRVLGSRVPGGAVVAVTPLLN